MPKQAKLTYDLVAKTIDNLIKNKANGGRFPTFMQIIKITGGNANTLNSYIKQYKELQAKNTNSQIEVLQQQLKKYADTNAKYVDDFTGLNTKIDNTSEAITTTKTTIAANPSINASIPAYFPPIPSINWFPVISVVSPLSPLPLLPPRQMAY